MKNKRQEIIEALHAVAEPDESNHDVGAHFNLDPSIIWVGRDAMRHILEKAEDAYYGFYSEDPDDEPHPGLRKIQEFLAELLSVSDMRLRLVFGSPENPLHELDLSDVPNSRGDFDTNEVKNWIAAGAALIADARPKSS